MNITLKQLQDLLPWTIRYDSDFRASPVKHKDFQHAAIHVMKALGKISAAINDAEHAGFDWGASDIPQYVADLVICALRMANTMPELQFDLEQEVIKRLEGKNGLRLMINGATGKHHWVNIGPKSADMTVGGREPNSSASVAQVRPPPIEMRDASWWSSDPEDGCISAADLALHKQKMRTIERNNQGESQTTNDTELGDLPK